MKIRFTLIAFAVLILIGSCSTEKSIEKVIDESLALSVQQYNLMTSVMKDKPDQLPRTLNENGELKTENSRWWTSGFYPGILWYLYEYSNVILNRLSILQKPRYETSPHLLIQQSPDPTETLY